MLDFKAQIEFQRTEIRNETLWGEPEKDGGLRKGLLVVLVWLEARPGPMGMWLVQFYRACFISPLLYLWIPITFEQGTLVSILYWASKIMQPVLTKENDQSKLSDVLQNLKCQHKNLKFYCVREWGDFEQGSDMTRIMLAMQTMYVE